MNNADKTKFGLSRSLKIGSALSSARSLSCLRGVADVCICAFVSAVLAHGALAAAPAPIVGWYGDFDVLTKDGCTLTVGEGNTVSSDGTTITIGSTEGVRVSWGTTQRRKYTVVVRYRDMTVPTSSSGAVLAGHAGGSSSGFMMTSAGVVRGLYTGTLYAKSPSASYPIADGSAGCYAMAFSTDVMEQSGVKG